MLNKRNKGVKSDSQVFGMSKHFGVSGGAIYWADNTKETDLFWQEGSKILFLDILHLRWKDVVNILYWQTVAYISPLI